MKKRRNPERRGRNISLSAPARAAPWPAARETATVLGLLAILTLAAFLPALWAGFVWDDRAFTTAPAVRDLSGIWQIWFNPEVLESEGHYWPLTYSTFWLQHAIFGFWAPAFHAFNLLLHFAVSALLWLLLRHWKLPGSLLAAVIFVLHPVHAEPAVWVIGRKDLMASLFVLASTIFWFRSLDAATGRWRIHGLSLGFYAASLLSKSTLVTLPVCLLVLAWWRRGRLTVNELVSLVPFVIVGALIAGLDTRYYKSREVLDFGYSILEKTQQAARSLWFYLGKLAWPVDLKVIYPRWQPDSLDPLPWLLVIATLALPLALWVLRFRIGRGPFAATSIFFILLSPSLGFVDYGYMQFSFVADRYQYLASAAPITVLAALAANYANRLGRRAVLAGWVVAALLSAGLATGSWIQAGRYKDPETFFSYILSVNPEARGANQNLGREYIYHKRFEDALMYSMREIQYHPDNQPAYSVAGSALLRMGRYEEALPLLNQAYRMDHKNASTLERLAVTSQKLGRTEDAIRYFNELEAVFKFEATLYLWRADAYLDHQNPIAAKADIANAFASRGIENLAEFGHYLHARADFALGDTDAALEHLQVSLSQRQTIEAQQLLAEIRSKRGEYSAAAENYRRLIELEPEVADHHVALGLVMASIGNFEEAVHEMNRALEIDPKNLIANRNLERFRLRLPPE